MDKILPHEQPTVVIPFHKLSPIDVGLCNQIGVRGAAMIRELMKTRKGIDIEVNPMICAMDIATVHLARPLALLTFLNAEPLAFMDEFIRISMNVDRTCGTFPNFIPLQFALSS